MNVCVLGGQCIIKVTLFGPESTGKTTLAQQLARHYQTAWVSEYARLYQERHLRTLTLDDVVPIARGQLYLEKQCISKARDLLICDTDLLETKVYSEIYYGTCPEWVLKNLPLPHSGIYLLMGIDLPWVADGVREEVQDRRWRYEKFKNELINRNLVFDEIIGRDQSRLHNAIGAIEKRWDEIKKVTNRNNFSVL